MAAALRIQHLSGPHRRPPRDLHAVCHAVDHARNLIHALPDAVQLRTQVGRPSARAGVFDGNFSRRDCQHGNHGTRGLLSFHVVTRDVDEACDNQSAASQWGVTELGCHIHSRRMAEIAAGVRPDMCSVLMACSMVSCVSSIGESASVTAMFGISQ